MENLTRHFRENPADLAELLFRRNGYTTMQNRKLAVYDLLLADQVVDLETYLQLILDERNRRQAECDAVAENLLAGVNF